MICALSGIGAGYSLDTFTQDQFAFHHKDMLILFAAGNSGESGDSTISTQAEFKNGLTVGSVGH